MRKPTGFMEINRKDPGYRPVNERLRDFKAVENRLPEPDLVLQAARCMDCGIPFCHGYGCPVGNFIPEWNDLVCRGKWHEALALLLSTDPFPEFTSRICPAPCEASCVLGITSPPVSIRQIEGAIIEKGFQEGWIVPDRAIPRNGKRVAVVGSGPAGLAVADELNRRGYLITVYEAAAFPGGILRYGIPDFKLEKWIVERRVQIMREEGVVFETKVRVGVDISSDYLLSRNDAVCLTGGARAPRDLPIPGRDLAGIHFALDFLTQQNRVVNGEVPSGESLISAAGKSVLVIGGGDTGADCIGTSLRQGAKEVTQVEIMPRPPECRDQCTPWPEWPYKMRSSSSHEEGCNRLWSLSAKSFMGAEGRVYEAEFEQVEWENGPNGMPAKFHGKPGTNKTIRADLVFLAMGFSGPLKDELLSRFGVKLDGRGLVEKNPRGMTSVEKVFTAGDMTKGASLVVRAMADGRETAHQIDEYLQLT